MVIPVQIAVIAPLGAIYYGYHAVQESAARGQIRIRPRDGLSRVQPSRRRWTTTRLVSKRAASRSACPTPSRQEGRPRGHDDHGRQGDVGLWSDRKSGKISPEQQRVHAGHEEGVTDVRVVESEWEPMSTGTRPRRPTDGHVNEKKEKITFVNVVVKAETRNYAINAFTAVDSDPIVRRAAGDPVNDSLEVIESPWPTPKHERSSRPTRRGSSACTCSR